MTDHERNEIRERRRSRLSPAGAEVLDELERLEEALEPPSEKMLARIARLPSSDRAEIAAIFGGMSEKLAKRQRENMQAAAQLASFEEAILEAQERQRAAGMPVDQNMIVGDALEILGR